MKKKVIGIFVCCILLTITVPFTVLANNEEEYILTGYPPTTITIHRPEEGNLYVMGAQMIRLPFNLTVILGPITIEAYVTGINGFQVEFYIDEALKITDSSPPFEYPWWDLSFGIHTIEVKLVGYELSDTLQVFKIL